MTILEWSIVIVAAIYFVVVALYHFVRIFKGEQDGDGPDFN
jgi:hypothetical protein